MSDSLENNRWRLDRGEILQRVLRVDPDQDYLIFVPTTLNENTRVLVFVHGTSGNAQDPSRWLAPRCEEHNLVLLVPLFTERHSDYQRLGRVGRGARSDHIMDQCVAEVGSLCDIDVSNFFLFGYSGGAQFAHRYTMAHPHRVIHAVVLGSGWYTFPDPTERYPYGINATRSLPNVVFNPEAYLRVPIDVFIGVLDVGSANLRVTDRTNTQQGFNRVERARNWVKAMQASADQFNFPQLVNLTELPNAGHSFDELITNSNLATLLFDTLLQSPETLDGDDVNQVNSQVADQTLEQEITVAEPNRE